jgi:signal transduction histidine kinase
MIAIDPESLSELETDLWQNPKARVLCEGPEDPGLASLPDHFRRSDISQIYAHPLLGGGKDRAVFLFCKRREPFNDLDLKFVALVSAFFHKRVFMLREREMLRELEVAYLDQEMTLRQSEKLATLGKMSAGMAHELNNPASAARRSAEQLREVIDTMQTARFHLGGLGLSEDQLEEVRLFEVAAIGLARRPDSLEPLERSDREEVMETWLDDRDVDDPWELAPSLVSMGQQPETLEHLAESFEAEEFDVVLQALASHFTVHRLLVEMGHGTNRIADIVGALKSYTYLDQAPVQEIDVREGLDDTLVMLNSKLKDGVSVERDYQEDLPRIEAHGSELNQVWTNLIDNAVAAIGGEGKLRLRAYTDDSYVVVEVVDDGPGVPREVQENVFDPFFTTKAPGEGTGLGLNISHNIVVQKHKGEISVDSKPGETRFVVRLPATLEGAT